MIRSLGLLLFSALLASAVPVAAEPLAKDLFGTVVGPAAGPARVHGTYSRGCFAGGTALAADGPNWQAMRPSRNRAWGHPAMIDIVERLSRDAAADGWPGLLVGDISQPRGGPMLSGHASHQLGLDADVWFLPMPARRLSPAEREGLEFVSLIEDGGLAVDEARWSPAHAALLRRAASYGAVERILVHPGIKRKLCETARGDRSWLGKVRPFWGHDSHFHIRIGCPDGSPGCRPQEPVARGEGCDASLDWWFTEEPWRPATGPQEPRARDVMTLADLPDACRAVVGASGATGQAGLPSAVPVPTPRPRR